MWYALSGVDGCFCGLCLLWLEGSVQRAPLVTSSCAEHVDAEPLAGEHVKSVHVLSTVAAEWQSAAARELQQAALAMP
jgi:hypothetical protein